MIPGDPFDSENRWARPIDPAHELLPGTELPWRVSRVVAPTPKATGDSEVTGAGYADAYLVTFDEDGFTLGSPSKSAPSRY